MSSSASAWAHELAAVVVVSLISGAAAGLVTWGAMQAEVKGLRAELEVVRADVRELRAYAMRAEARPAR